MNVVNYLRSNSIESLSEKYGIHVKYYPDLLVLNYKPWNNPQSKFNEIVKECRGLILNRHTLEIVSRSFDRFFDYDELLEEWKRLGKNEKDLYQYIDSQYCTVTEKIDGSLIKIYRYGGEWHVSTRGTAFGECSAADGITFRDLVFKTLQVNDRADFQNFCNRKFLHCNTEFTFDPNYTYIFELSTPHHRIIRNYEGKCYILWFLAVRRNDPNGTYRRIPREFYFGRNVKFPERHVFYSLDRIMDWAQRLPGEGFVLFQYERTEHLPQPLGPICKIKSSAYVENARLKTCMTGFWWQNQTNLLEKILKLVVSGEYHEYLTNRPEEKDFLKPYVDKVNAYLEGCNDLFRALDEEAREDERRFQHLIQKLDCSWLMSLARRCESKDLIRAFRNFDDTERKARYLSTRIDWSRKETEQQE